MKKYLIALIACITAYTAFGQKMYNDLPFLKGEKFQKTHLKFDTKLHNKEYRFLYSLGNDNGYLKLLRQNYPLDSLIRGAKTDAEKALRILNWVHNQWKHDGNNEPAKRDAISILEEVKQGKRFRCVEYGIVLSACLKAVGLPARMLGLKTKDVETTQSGAGHVVSEVYLKDLNKWAFLDGQMDVMPVLNGVPLNAVEFQKALTENYQELEIKSLSGEQKYMYAQWIYPYLYYFDVSFDNREGEHSDKLLIDGKRSLMLVPEAAKNPTVFQRVNQVDYVKYTHSLKDFYQSPQK